MWRYIPGASKPAVPSSSKAKKHARDHEYDAQKRVRSYRKEWESDFEWLGYDDEEQVMFCQVCREQQQTGATGGMRQNPFYKGTDNFRLDSIKSHTQSENHQLATSQKRARAFELGKSPAERMLTSINASSFARLQVLFRNAHAIASHCRPFSDFSWMAALDSAKGLDVGQMYINDKSARQFIHYIAEVERLNLKEELERAKYISLISDGTTDASITEAEILYIRYAINGTSKTHFVGVTSVAKADAESITKAITDGLDKNLQINSEVLRKKLVGFGSDGASVMIGRNGGVATLLKTRHSPVLQAVHCTAHRLELAFKDALKNVALYSTLSTLVLGLYLFYHNSSKNRSGLKLAADAVNQPVAIPTRTGGTRWLPHLQRALQQIMHGYKALVTHLQQVEAEPGMSIEARGKAKHFLKQLRRHDLMKFAHFMIDVVVVLSRVSLEAQRTNNTVAEVAASIEAASATLAKYKTRKMTPNLQSFGEDGIYKNEALTGSGDIKTAMVTVLSGLERSLDGRFADMNNGVLSALRISSFKFWLSKQDPDSEDFGCEHVKVLVDHFAPVLEEAGVATNEVAVEWEFLKERVYGKYKTVANATWEDVMSFVQSDLPNICSLIDLTLTIPASSADAERGFSQLKLLKTDQRTRLKDDGVCDQMMVVLHSPNIDEFDPSPAINLWNTAGSRRRRFEAPDSSDSEED